jgi:TrmH family RNA methyltransferase
LYDLKLSDNPLILVAEAPEPGNIGALRTADAAHLDAVIIESQSDYTTRILCVLV